MPSSNRMVMLGALVAVLALTAASAAAKPPDTAKIVEHVSAGGVKIGAKRSAVLRAWGKPTMCFVAATSWAPSPVDRCSWGTPGQQPSQLEVEFMKARVISIHVRLIPDIPGGFPGWTTAKRGPMRPKWYICSGETGGRGPNQSPRFLKTGPSAIVGSCGPVDGQGFSWTPDTTSEHGGYGDE
jgi:hypothetical protein